MIRNGRENEKILSRDFHKKAKNILEDSVKKVGKWIVDTAKLFNVSAVFLEDLDNMIKKVKRLPVDFRDRLYLIQYHRIQ
ncbi:hypothetical protein BFU36_07465 [Sulfolobus sp. A20]|uniref:IS200/IS605 family accessory protein TnpB-related protein n=1 Tax=Sulfolobaceae TaxID=118883 RepID=UPI000845EF33|nr:MULTISPECIES: IS200/IS605 family accessory protein TnpB-related protein [unclassified Sulfolobus]AOL16560.1 hypothetical protein BFU36_07465 [Sulfolobus sp. A20]